VNGRKFDAQVVLTPKNSSRGQLMQQYVLVRLVSMAGVDIGLFDYDRHNSIYFFVLNADEQIYLRYGGRDAEDGGTYLNLESIELALKGGLEQHAVFKSGKLPKQPRPAPMFPQQIASLKREVIERNRCVECHLIGDYLAQDQEKAGTLDKIKTLYPSPDLKTIGIHLDIPKGLVVGRAEGAAAAAGVKPGDLITAFNRTPVLTFGDLQHRYGKLDRGATRFNLTVDRAGTPQTLALKLPTEWWYTDTSYRFWTVEPMIYFSSKPLDAEKKRALRLKPDGFASEVVDVDPLGESLNLHTLKAGDVIYAVDGVETSKLTRNIELYIKLTARAGESVKLKLYREGKPMEMTLKTYRQYFRKQRSE
jgi:serine protease Do